MREKLRMGELEQERERKKEGEENKKKTEKQRKSAEEKEDENRWRRQVQRWPRHVACQISIYRATKMTKLKRTARFRRPTANHTPSGLRRFSFPDLFVGVTFSPWMQIEKNPAPGSVPARNATNFAQPLNRDELYAKHGDLRHGKILGFLFNPRRPCSTINLVDTSFSRTLIA